MSDDPSIRDLRCPTCGAGFHRLVRFEHDDDSIDRFSAMSGPANHVRSRGRPYLVCVHGHQWTIKILTRTLNQPDQIMLGYYIGQQ